jgi:hypothetical protein
MNDDDTQAAWHQQELEEAARALLEAQKRMDCEAEAEAILRVMGPKRECSGRQHASVPLHIRIVNRVRFGATDCWHWCGVRNAFGYGRMTYQGRAQVAHRLAWMAWKGPIPDGMSVLHRCDNPSCVNPDHLWLGTYSDNLRDCWSKGRHPGKRRSL